MSGSVKVESFIHDLVPTMLKLKSFLHLGRSRPDALPTVEATIPSLPLSYFLPMPASELLATARRQQWLQSLWDYSSLPKEMYRQYNLVPLEHCVTLMQEFPLTESGPYALPGGMADYMLETVSYAARLSKSYMLPVGAPPEEQAAQSAAWNAVGDINLEERWIDLNIEGAKNHREHRVPIVSALYPSLEELVRKAGEVGMELGDQFFNVGWFDLMRKSKYPEVMNEYPLRAFFRRLSRECKFTISPHWFRHTVATHMMKSPERNLYAVKKLLGHVSITSTLEYIDESVDSLREILEAELM